MFYNAMSDNSSIDCWPESPSETNLAHSRDPGSASPDPDSEEKAPQERQNPSQGETPAGSDIPEAEGATGVFLGARSPEGGVHPEIGCFLWICPERTPCRRLVASVDRSDLPVIPGEVGKTGDHDRRHGTALDGTTEDETLLFDVCVSALRGMLP